MDDAGSSSSFNWRVIAGPVPTSGYTGPLSDASGIGQYMYTESSRFSPSVTNMQLPSFDLTSLLVPELQFKYHMFGSTMGNLYVQVSIDSGSSWSTIDSLLGAQQLNQTDPWLSRLVDLSAYSTANTLIRFQATQVGGAGDISIDEVSVYEAPPCPTPRHFATFNITPTTADVTFTAQSGATHVVEWGPTGYLQGTGTRVSSTSDTVSLSGLPSGMCLDVYIQADCSANGNDTSIVVGPYQLCTPCSAAPLPYIQRFNSWPLYCEDPSAGTISWAEDNGWAEAAFFGLPNQDFVLKMQDVLIDASARVSFTWSHSYDSNYPTDNFSLLARPQGATQWDTIWFNQGVNFDSQDGASALNPGTGVEERLNLSPAYVGQVLELELHGTSGGGPNLFIDDFIVDSIPSCVEPYRFRLARTTDSSISFTWIADATAANSTIEYGPEGFVPGTGLTANGAGDSVYISGLSPRTSYDFYVSVACPNSSSSISKLFTARTECAAFFSAPYFEDFSLTSYGVANANFEWENCFYTNPIQSAFSLRWETEDAEGVNENSPDTGPHYDHTTPNTPGGGYIYLESSVPGIERSIYSPYVEMSVLSTPTLEFAYHMYGSSTGSLAVDVWDGTKWNMDVFVVSGQQQTAGDDPWIIAQIPLSIFSSDTIQVRWRGNYAGQFEGDIAIDDFSISDGPNCTYVWGGDGENIDSTSADLVWSSYTTSDYTVEWGPCGFVPGTGGVSTILTNVQNGHTLTGLSPNTCYEFYVINNCDPSGTQYGPYSFSTSCVSTLNGTYTVGGQPGTTNFPNLNAAVASLDCGITGPVTFQILSNDTTTSILHITDVVGSSSINTITFDGLGTAHVYKGGFSGPIWNLDGASNIVLKNMILVDTVQVEGLGVRLTGDADDNIIEGNTFRMVDGSSAFAFTTACIAVTGSSTSLTSPGADVNGLVIRNNTFRGAYYGVTAFGGSSLYSKIDSITIIGNVFEDQYQYGILLYYYNEAIIHDNSITGLANSVNSYGIYMNFNDNADITSNIVEGGRNAIYIAGMNFSDPNGESNIINNFIHGLSATASNPALYTRSSNSKINLYHNTILADVGVGWEDRATNTIDCRNNVIVAGDLVLDFRTAPGTADVFDYNLYFRTTPGNLLEWPSPYADLSALQTGISTHNVNSRSGDPLFLSTSSYQLLGGIANDAGDNSVGVSTDIEGDARPIAPSTTVDLGADEFNPVLWDAAAVTISEPLSSDCGDTAVQVSMVIRNIGANNITSLQAGAYVSGSTNANLSTVYTGSLPQGMNDTVTIGTFNIASGGSVSVIGYIMLTNDVDNSNDTTATVNATFIPSQPQAFPPDTLCEGTIGELHAMPQPGIVYGWYENASDTVALARGDTLNFTADRFQNTYYLAYEESELDTLETVTTASSGCSAGTMFDISLKKGITLETISLLCAANATTQTSVDVYYKLGSYAGSENVANAWTLHETVSFVSNGPNLLSYAHLAKPLHLPPGAVAMYLDYDALYSSNGPTVFQNDDLKITAGIGLCSTFGLVRESRIFNGGLIYRRDLSCAGLKVPVTYTVIDLPQLTFTTGISQNGNGTVSFNASASNFADSIYWDFGDGNTGVGVNPVHTYSSNGTYTVMAIAFNDCGTDTLSKTITIGGINVVELSGLGDLRLFPNPTTGVVHVSMSLYAPQELTIEVLNLQGQSLHVEKLGRIEGEFTWRGDLSTLPRGSYFVRLIGHYGVQSLPLTLN